MWVVFGALAAALHELRLRLSWSVGDGALRRYSGGTRSSTVSRTQNSGVVPVPEEGLSICSLLEVQWRVPRRIYSIVSPVLHFVPIVWIFFTSAPCTYWITNNRWLRKCRRFSLNLVLQVRNFFYYSNLKNILENYQKFHLFRRTCEYQGSRRTFRGGEIFKNFSTSNSKTPYFRLLLQFFTPILTWW